MEPVPRKRKITDHFRVALKPRDVNIPGPQKKQKIEQPETSSTLTKTTIEKSKSTAIQINTDIDFEPHYAWDSFKYDREQELKFRNTNYFDDVITPPLRARHIKWLIELQDVFGLCHEPLYMAVKMADQYLMRKSVAPPQLQLLYMTAMLIAAKFDERLTPVMISRLLRRSGNIYNREQVIRFELDLLITLDFNIRYPLSIVFLKRFARCTGSDLKTRKLARKILESSLMAGEMIDALESELAAVSLFSAFELLKLDKKWNETAEYFTGYKKEDLAILRTKLNEVVPSKRVQVLSSIINSKTTVQNINTAREI